MVVVDFLVQLPEFGPIFETFDAATVDLVDMRNDSDGAHGLFWISDASLPGVVECLETDPSVDGIRQLSGDGDQNLYRIDFTEAAKGIQLYREIVDHDGDILKADASEGDWHLELFFPSRESLSSFYERCLDLGLTPKLQSIHDAHAGPSFEEYGLTDSQRQCLVRAAKEGYFSVPKEISLVELAGELDISDQAASERLRRGMQKLVENTLMNGLDRER